MVAARRRPPMSQPGSNAHHVLPAAGTGALSYWRVEGSLLELGALRPVGFFTWNSQSFSERWARRAGMAGMALARPFAYFASRTFATRFLHTLLRGVSRVGLDRQARTRRPHPARETSYQAWLDREAQAS